MGQPILKMKYTDIEKAEEIRERLERIKKYHDIPKETWNTFKFSQSNGRYDLYDDYLNWLFRDAARVMRAALTEEITRLKAELRVLGVDV